MTDRIKEIEKQIQYAEQSVGAVVLFLSAKSDAVRLANYFRNKGYACVIESGHYYCLTIKFREWSTE